MPPQIPSNPAAAFASNPAAAFAEIHAPCSTDDAPLPPPCRFPGHVHTALPKRYQGRCRVARLPVGGHLLFGAVRPAGVGSWLQVGLAQPAQPSAISGVVGHAWVTPLAEGARLMVENVSSNNTLELRSPRLPRSLTLYPVVEADDNDSQDDVLGTPVVAVQTTSSTLIVTNQSEQYPIWIEVQIRPMLSRISSFTRNPRAALAEEQQSELDAAALRIQLAAPENYELLAAFATSKPVEERLTRSETLKEFLLPSGLRRVAAKAQKSPLTFRDEELENIREGKPTHEIHRLILEAIGIAPQHASKWYTKLVSDQLAPEKSANSRRGGAAGGLNNLIPAVKGHWAFRRYQLEEYLGIGRERGQGLGRDLDLD